MVARPLRLGGRNSRRRIPRGTFHHRLFQGRALYGAIATYHAYLEFPVLLALIMSPGRRGGAYAEKPKMPETLVALKSSALQHFAPRCSASGTS